MSRYDFAFRRPVKQGLKVQTYQIFYNIILKLFLSCRCLVEANMDWVSSWLSSSCLVRNWERNFCFLYFIKTSSGEMAGVGVLALPKSMVGTGELVLLSIQWPSERWSSPGPAGFALLIYFTINAMFSGSRLGLCWVMICERWEKYKEGVSTYRVQYRKGSVQEGFRTGRVQYRKGSL